MIINQRLYASTNGKDQTFIKFEPFQDGNMNDKFWFNVVNENGNTEVKPYGITTRERLESLRDQLIELLK